MSQGSQDFFIGFGRPPSAIAGFALRVGAILIAGFAALALALGSASEDAGPGQWAAEVSVQGELVLTPYPLLRVHGDAGVHTIMLAGDGKVGVQGEGAALDSKLVGARGAMLRRGTLDMLVVGTGGLAPLTASEAPKLIARQRTSLGTWRLSGEICDGKCLGGAMRPGTGLAHKACANLCISGGQPPVFASSGAVAGQSFLLLANSDGEAAPSTLQDLTAIPVELEGEVEKLDDLLIFRVDWSKALRR